MVISLNENAHDRRHRAYTYLDLEKMRKKALEFPSHGVPEQILKLLPHDNLLHKIQVQKAATLVAGLSKLEDVGKQMSYIRPNGVVLEQSTHDAVDINAQQISALTHFAHRLNVDCVNDVAESQARDDDLNVECEGTTLPEMNR